MVKKWLLGGLRCVFFFALVRFLWNNELEIHRLLGPISTTMFRFCINKNGGKGQTATGFLEDIKNLEYKIERH